MLPVDLLPIGQPVPVRIEVTGGEAKMTIAGQPQGSAYVTGAPTTSGSVGFLHYYNYAFDVRDLVITPQGGPPIRVDFSRPLDREFWARIEPTYEAGDGVLKVRDSEAVQFHLRVLGAPGREIIRARAEGYGVRGQAPLEGHLIVRERPADPARVTTFAAIMEAVKSAPRVARVQSLAITSGTDDAAALQVECVEADGRPRVDIVVSAVDASAARTIAAPGAPVEFQGRFGLVTVKGGKVTGLMLVGGGQVACGGRRLDLPGSVHGRVQEALVADAALLVELDAGSAPLSEELVGRRLLVTSPAFVCPSVYTVRRIQRVDPKTWRLGLNMPLVVARGVVGSVAVEQGAFASRTPVMKLRVNPGLFDGKCVRRAPGAKEYRLKTATEAAFALAQPTAVREFEPGAEYLVCDVGVGDRVEVIAQGSRSFP